jgi:hypothetical protein
MMGLLIRRGGQFGSNDSGERRQGTTLGEPAYDSMKPVSKECKTIIWDVYIGPLVMVRTC